MKKYIRKHLKDQKRILKLMYRKGVLDALVFDIRDCNWEFLLRGKRGRKRKNKQYSFDDRLPEFHVYTIDYWGEADSHSLIDSYRETVMMENANFCPVDGWSNVNTDVVDSKGLIKYLSDLPTIRSDSKFNQYLKISQ